MFYYIFKTYLFPKINTLHKREIFFREQIRIKFVLFALVNTYVFVQ